MSYIKHKNMRDVCAQVLERDFEPVTSRHKIKVLWFNLLGTYDHPQPFPIGVRNKLAIETIYLSDVEFTRDWLKAADPEEFKGGKVEKK